MAFGREQSFVGGGKRDHKSVEAAGSAGKGVDISIDSHRFRCLSGKGRLCPACLRPGGAASSGCRSGIPCCSSESRHRPPGDGRESRWGVDPDFHDVAFQAHDFYDDPAVDHNAFTGLARENQHGKRVGGKSGNRQWMAHWILGGIDRDDLFSDPRPAIDDDGAF